MLNIEVEIFVFGFDEINVVEFGVGEGFGVYLNKDEEVEEIVLCLYIDNLKFIFFNLDLVGF